MSPVPSDGAIEARLQVWPVARLATLRENGAPHLVPVVFAYSDGAFWIPVDGKPKRERELERIQNLRRDARATLLVDEYGDDWKALWWIHIECEAEMRQQSRRVGGAGEPGVGRFRRARDELLAKYPQYSEWPLFRGEPTLIELAPKRRNAWCADLEKWEQSGG
jgi:PPOX class probable F420-dependent enzyme